MKIGEEIKQNIKLHYEIYGTGKPLIFLHGAFWNISHYKEMIAILSKKYKIFAVDLPMHGKSPSAYIDFYKSSELVHKIITENKIKNPEFICHSAGSAIAIIYASKYKTKKMFLIAPAGLRFFNHNIEFFSKALFAQPISSYKYAGKNAFKFYEAGIEFIKKNFGSKDLIKLMDKELKENLEKEMKKIKCPVTIIWTKEDELLPIRHSIQFLRNIKNSKLIITHGCHNWPVLTPKKISEFEEIV